MLLGGALALGAGLLFSYPLARMYPENDLPEIILLLFGKIVGNILVGLLLITVLLHVGFTIRVFVQALRVFLLYETPVYAIILLITLTVVSVGKRDAKTIAASIDFMFPVYLSAMVVLMLFSIPQIDLINIQPVLYKNKLNALMGTIPAYSALVGSNAVIYFTKYHEDVKKSKKWFVIALLLVIFLYTCLTTIIIMVFGPEEVRSMAFPTLELARAIRAPVSFFERLESMVATIWIPGVFAWMVLYCFASIRNFTVLFHIKARQKKYLTFLHIVLIAIIASIPHNWFQAFQFHDAVVASARIFGLGLIPVMTVMGYIKKRRKAK